CSTLARARNTFWRRASSGICSNMAVAQSAAGGFDVDALALEPEPEPEPEPALARLAFRLSTTCTPSSRSSSIRCAMLLAPVMVHSLLAGDQARVCAGSDLTIAT